MAFRGNGNITISGPFTIDSITISGGGTPVNNTAWQIYELADASSSNGQSIVTSGFTASAEEDGFIECTMQTGVNASTVGAMAYIEWALKDLEGNALSTISETSLLSAIVQFLGARLPNGARVGVAFTVGGMAAVSKGIATGVQGTSNGLVPWHSGFAASWTAAATGGAADKLATCGQMQVLRGNSLTNIRLSSSIRLPDNEMSKQAATTSPLTSTAGGSYDHVALLIGNTASQASPLSVSCGIKTFLQRLSTITNMSRKTTTPAPVIRRPSDGDFNYLFMGHSLAFATVAGNQASGPVTAGYTYYNQDGLADATWDALSSPGHSISAALLDDTAAVVGNTGGYLIRRSASGAQLAATSVADEHLGSCVYDVEDNSLDDPDCVIVWYGANDANGTEAQANAYITALRRHIELIRERYPNAIIVLPSEHTTTPGTYVYLATTEAAKATVATEYDHVYHVTYDYQTASQNADGIHPNADGYDAIGSGIAAVLAAL